MIQAAFLEFQKCAQGGWAIRHDHYLALGDLENIIFHVCRASWHLLIILPENIFFYKINEVALRNMGRRVACRVRALASFQRESFYERGSHRVIRGIK